jgi:hypothetical protein
MRSSAQRAGNRINDKVERDMAMNTSFQHQQPLSFSAAVRSTPSAQHAARLDIAEDQGRAPSEPPVKPEEKSFAAHLKR